VAQTPRQLFPIKEYGNEQNVECRPIAKRPVVTRGITRTDYRPCSKKSSVTEEVFLQICQVCTRFLSDKERNSLFQSLRPAPCYDFRIADPPYIENSSGNLFPLTLRCWNILSQATLAPVSIQNAEDFLNLKLECQDGKKEILLDRKAIEYIVSATNRVLLVAKSTNRLSAKGSSFSVR